MQIQSVQLVPGITKLLVIYEDTTVEFLTEDDIKLISDWFDNYDVSHYDPSMHTVNTLKEIQVERVRIEAQQRIYECLPIPDAQGITDPIAAELNLVMHMIALARKEVKGTATASEVLELDLGEDVRAAISDIRLTAAEIALDIYESTDPLSIPIDTNILWP